MNCSCSPHYDPNCPYVKGAQTDPAMTPTEFVNSILSACDASNWDADRNTGDYFKGLRDAYEAVQEIATDYQTAMYEWTRGAGRPVEQEVHATAWTGYLADRFGRKHRCWGFGTPPDDAADVTHLAAREDEQALRKAREALLASEGVPLSDG
jgi:hypothetical protein